MPLAAPRPCPYPGCGVLVDGGGHCARHKVQRQRMIDANRASSNARGYTSRWRKARAGWLRKHPLCGDRASAPSAEHSACVRTGRVCAATDVDHIKPHRGDMSLFWDASNWQSLCGSCHSVKTACEDGGFGNASTAGEATSEEGWGGSNL